MKETADLVMAWRALPAGNTALLATVVGTSGSTYRKAGARMLLSEDGWLAGSISGGCLEGDVQATAWDRTAHGPAMVTYDATADDDIVWGFGLGCNGKVQVLMERIGPDGGPLAFLADCIEKRQQGVMATVVAEGPDLGRHWRLLPGSVPAGLMCEAEKLGGRAGFALVEFDGKLTLLESVLPPTALVIFGAGHDAAALVEAAKGVGWHVSVLDHRASHLRKDRFPGADELRLANPAELEPTAPHLKGAAAVVMTHNYLNDFALLKALLSSEVGYIGLLGPRRRADRMLSEIDVEYAPESSRLAVLHAPIGLDIGAETPDEIAVAIVAEIQAFLKQRNGGFLREYAGPLHLDSIPVLKDTTKESASCDLSA